MGTSSSLHSTQIPLDATTADLEDLSTVSAKKTPEIGEGTNSSPKEVDNDAPLADVQAHVEEINCLAVSADATMVASGSEDCSVRVWSLERLECFHEFLGHGDYITCLVFADQTLLSGSGDMTVRKWDLLTGDCIFTITGHTGTITSICFTQTQVFTSGNDSVVHCWSLEAGIHIREFKGHSGSVYGIHLTAGEGDLTPRDLKTATSRRRARFVTFSADCTARLWNATRSSSLQTFVGHAGPVTCVAVDQERHYLFTGSSDSRIASWLMETGQRIHWFEGHTAPVIDLLIAGDYLYSASSDETARTWVTDIAQELQVFKRHEHTVFRLALRGDMLITGSGDGRIRCFNTKTAVAMKEFVYPNEDKFCCFAVAENTLIAASQKGKISSHDLSALIERAKD